MSTISTFYDALLAKLADIWPLANHIPDPTDFENTATLNELQNGYGIAILGAVGDTRELSCLSRYTRDVMIIRTFLVTANQHDNSNMVDTIQELLEDQILLRNALIIDNTIGGISDIAFVSDSGIERLTTAQGKFHVMSSLYTFTYIENPRDIVIYDGGLSGTASWIENIDGSSSGAFGLKLITGGSSLVS
jgi:hypothetical protein